MGRFKDRFLPDIYLESIYDLDAADLKKRGFDIEAIIFDIDNTLVSYNEPVAPDITADFFERLKDENIKTYIVSNNNETRVKKFAESLGVSYYAAALKPFKKYMKKACADMGVAPGKTLLAGDQLFTDIYGGNRMGMPTLLVKPVSQSDKGFVGLKRKLEKLVLKGESFRER